MSDKTVGGRPGVFRPPFVGRDEARRPLDAALERALRYEAPQFVTVVGAPGMGKTRCLEEWLRDTARRGDFRVIAAASPAPTPDGEPFAAVARLLRSRFGIASGFVEGDALAALRREMQAVFGDRRVNEAAALIGHFLGCEAPESPLARSLAAHPEHETEMATAILTRFLEEDARRRPLVLALDDAHLADDASLDLLACLARDLVQGPLVFLVGARPELCVRRPDWGRGPGSHVRVDLAPLSEPQLDVLCRALPEARDLEPSLAARARVECGGNPFLLFELLRAYRRHGIAAAYTASHAVLDTEIGATPSDDARTVLLRRLADLAPAERDLLARASAFGGTFWTGGVIALGRLGVDPRDAATVFAPDPAIDETRRLLDELAERGYLVRASASTLRGEVEWAFRDGDERQSLAAAVPPDLQQRRQRFAAQWIEGRAAGALTVDRLELIARLYEEGGDVRRAGQVFAAAADEARRRRRHQRSRALYLRALRLLDVDDSVLRLDVLHCLGDVAARLGRHVEALAHFEQMLRVAWRMDLPAKGAAAHARIGRVHRALGDYGRALEHLDLAHLLFDLAADRAGIAATLDDVGRVLFLLGRTQEAEERHRTAYALREALGDDRGKALTLGWLGLIEAHEGRLAAAAECFRRALDLARRARDPHRIVFALVDLAGVEREAGQAARAERTLLEARGLVQEMGEGLYLCQVGLQLGECLLSQGRAGEAAREALSAHGLAKKFGTRRLLAEAEKLLGEIRLHEGDLLAARDHAWRAVEIAERVGVPALAAAGLRVLATAVARGAPGDVERGGAREIFDRALELATQVGAELEVGRVLDAYARYELDIGRDEAAAALRAQAREIWDRARAGTARRSRALEALAAV